MGRRIAIGVLACAAALQLACLAAVSPRPGRPVSVGPGEALVFGRIRVARPEYARGSPDEELRHDDVFRLELRGLRKPGGAVKYVSNPAPTLEDDGSFHWILAAGDYLIASYPPTGPREPADATVLARFTVPPGAGTVYVGTLDVSVHVPEASLIDVLLPTSPESPIVVNAVTVADDGERAFAALLRRYPSVPEPRAVAPMVAR